MNKARVAEAARGLFQFDHTKYAGLYALYISDRVDFYCNLFCDKQRLLFYIFKVNTQSARERT